MHLYINLSMLDPWGHVCFLCRAPQAPLGWKLSVLMDIPTTTTQKLEVSSEKKTPSLKTSNATIRSKFTYSSYLSLTESSWERPVDFPPYEAAQYGSGSSKERESHEEASTPQPEPLSAGKESSNKAPASQQAEDGGQAGQQSEVSKISFRVRRVLSVNEN